MLPTAGDLSEQLKYLPQLICREELTGPVQHIFGGISDTPDIPEFAKVREVESDN